MSIFLKDEQATLEFGQKLARHCPSGMNIYLHGDLGAGKTTLVRGLIHYFLPAAKVKSPTYTLVEPYSVQGRTLYHFDLYRINNTRELEDIGLRDYFDQSACCLVEWPEHGGHFLGEPDILIQIKHADPGRNLKLTAKTPDGVAVLAGLHNQ